MFDELKKYKNYHGNCNVLKSRPEDKKLANWAANQRAFYNNNKLSEDRIKRLEDIGFEWDRHK